MTLALGSVWLGSAGAGAAYAIARRLRQRHGRSVSITTADTNPRELVGSALLADRFVRVHPVADSRFREELLEGLASDGIDIYQPILDEEIVLAAELDAAGALPVGVRRIGPDLGAAQLCFDKLATARALERAGVPTPVTTLPGDAFWRPEGMFAKPRHGRGSIDARPLTDEHDLAALFSATELVVQVRCVPPEVTADVFVSSTGLVRTVCRERLEVKAGVCTKARVFEDEELADLTAAVVGALELRDTSCVQFMHDARGRWAVTDVNPRPGAGTAMTAAAGVDLLLAPYHERWGLDVEPLLGRLDHPRFVVRQYEELVTA